LALKGRQLNVKETVWEHLEREQAHLIPITFHQKELDQLDWKDEREFQFQGRMYDVKHAEVFADSITYFCYQDELETKIIHEIRELVEGWLDPSKSEQEESFTMDALLKTGLATTLHEMRFLQHVAADQMAHFRPYLFCYHFLPCRKAFVPPQY